MGIEDLQCIRHSPLLSVYYRTSNGWDRRKKLFNEGFLMDGKWCFEVVLCKYSTY